MNWYFLNLENMYGKYVFTFMLSRSFTIIRHTYFKK